MRENLPPPLFVGLQPSHRGKSLTADPLLPPPFQDGTSTRTVTMETTGTPSAPPGRASRTGRRSPRAT